MPMFALSSFWVLVNAHILGVHWILCSWALQILCADGVARTGDVCIFHSPMLMFHHPTELLLQSICSKVKSLRIQDSDLRVLKQAWEPSEQGTLCDCTGRLCMKSACVGVCVHSWTSSSIFLARRWRLFFILTNECLASQNEEKILF